MATLDMTKITEYLEKSMRNCSLNNQRTRVGDGIERSLVKEEIDDHIPMIGDKTLELNSHISIPSHLKQCLDLKTGEIYYINWNNGMRMNELVSSGNNASEYSGESYGSVFSEEDSSYYETEESSSESPRKDHKDEEEEEEEEEDVLVVAGCKACFMYFMVPKLLEDCPKCAAQLLHFARPPLHSASP